MQVSLLCYTDSEIEFNMPLLGTVFGINTCGEEWKGIGKHIDEMDGWMMNE